MRVYDHQEILEMAGVTWFHHRVLALACLCGITRGSVLLILPVLNAWIQCEFKVPAKGTTLMNTLMYAARAIGFAIQGVLSDRYGRIKSAQLFLALTAWSCIIFAVSPSLTWIIVCRIITGLVEGGLSYGFVVEYFAPKFRKLYSLTRDAYDFGGVLVMILTYISLHHVQWRTIFVILAAIPLLTFVLASKIPDPPRYLMVHGKIKEAAKSIITLTKSVSLKLPAGVNMPEHKVSIHASGLPFFSTLLSKKYRGAVCINSLLRFTSGLFSMGSSIMSVTYITGLAVTRLTVSNVKCSQCSHLGLSYYQDQIFLSVSSIVGGIICFLLLDRIGRIKVMAVLLFFNGLTFLSLSIWSQPLSTRIMFFIVKMTSTGFSNANFVYITELYPTYMRGRMVSLFGVMRTLGDITSVVMGELLIKWNSHAVILMCLAFSVASFVSCLFLPTETRGRKLEDF